MAQFTRAYSKLTDRLVEVAVLRRLGASYERRDAIACRKEINALSRGAVVLLCSHLEAYVKELGAVALDSMVAKDIPRTKLASRVYYHISKDLLEEVRSTLDPEKAANKVFAIYRQRPRILVQRRPVSGTCSGGAIQSRLRQSSFQKDCEVLQPFWL